MSLSRRQFLAVTGASAMMPTAVLAGEDWQVDFDAFVSDGMAKTRTPGLAVALIRQGRTVVAQGYGFADLAAKPPPTRPFTSPRSARL